MNNFAITLAAAMAFAVTGLLGFTLIPWLKKLKYGQTILDIGPVWHKSKQGTPTMGGILFIIGTILAVLTTLLVDTLSDGQTFAGETPLMKTRLWGGLLMALGFALIGFFDDYIKVVKKRNLGLTVLQKTFLQLLVAAGYMLSLYLAGDTSVMIPFLGNIELGIFYVVFGIFVIYFTVNAVNLTDGIDGLCATVTFVVALGFMFLTNLLAMSGLCIAAAALAGGCVGFLVWNWHPAKVFMGDTGSMFLGGMVVALAFGINIPVILLPIGIIYMVEAFSVVIQVLYFKKTGGKRLFKMTPIHHHFELSRWKEVKIVLVFSFVTLLGAIAAYLLVRWG